MAALHKQLAGIAGPILARVPLASWPPAASRLTGVLAPRAVTPHASPLASGGANIRMLLDFLDSTEKTAGDVAECGVWRGRSLIAMGLYLKQKRSSRQVWGFDSFQGFDQSVPHDFKNTSYGLVKQKAAAFGLSNVEIVPGYFKDSLATVRGRSFSFVHLDCDIYDSYRECLTFFYPRLAPGGVILFDEYGDPDWPGANHAVDEFCAEHNIPLHTALKDNFKKSFIRA